MGALAVIGGAYLSSGGFTTAFGYALGSLALNSVFGKQTIKGPRLNDLSVQGSDLDVPIPKLYGTGRLAGNIVWTTGTDEHKRKERAGKGGGTEVVNYTYSCSFAVQPGLGPIARPLKIWFGSKVIYDWNNGDPKGAELSYDEENECYFADEGTKDFSRLWVYRGTETQGINPLIEEHEGVGNTQAWRGRVLIVVEDLQLEEYGNSPPPITALMEECTTNARDIANDISRRAGLIPQLHCDYRELGDEFCEGFILGEQTQARDYLAMMGTRFGCEWPERDGRIVAMKFGRESCVSIPDRDLQVHEAGSSVPDTQWDRSQESGIPYRYQLQYLDKNRNYTPNAQHAHREVTTSELKEMVAVPMVMSGIDARTVASRELYRKWLEREGPTIQFGWKYLWLAPSDVITINTNSGQREVRLQSGQTPYFGPIVYRGVLNSAELRSIPATLPTTPPTYPEVIESGALTNLLIETHSMVDALNGNPQIYVASASPSGTAYAGVVVSPLNSGPGAVTQLPYRATIGTTVDSLGGHPDADVWDESNSVTVDLLAGELESCSELEILNSTNAFLLRSGNDWELVQFQYAELLGTIDGKKRYRLSRFLRGRRGTEVFMGGHVPGDVFLFVDAGVENIELPVATIGSTPGWVFSTSGSSEDKFEFIDGINLKPYAPCDMQGSRTGGDLDVQWKRRSRYRGSVLNPPVLGEDFEEYEIEVMNGSTVVRTVTGLNTPSWTYTATQQALDFGTTQSSVKLRIYQISNTVGRGYYLEGTL